MLCGMLLTLASAFAQKPKWVGNTPQELNRTYKFVEIVSYGNGMDAARMDAVHLLALDQRITTAMKVSVETGMLTQVDQTTKDGEMQENINEKVEVSVRIGNQDYTVHAVRVDEYVAGISYGRMELHTLYMVALCNDPVFDRTYLTTSYGIAPVVMSVIPGLGQWYKGSRVKGALFFSAAAASAAGVIICENQRSTYKKKIKEQPKFAKEFSEKADNWEIGRNVAIGVAAGFWVYNLVDAAVAKGARRVQVRRAGKPDISLVPFAGSGCAGMALAFRF